MFTFACLAVAAALPLAAQPVRDIADAPEAVRAHARDMKPVIDQVRELAPLLKMLADVQRELSDTTQPRLALDQAIHVVDDYAGDLVRRGVFLERGQRDAVDLTRRLLDDARKNAGTDLVAVREKIHHDVIHPMQRRAVQVMHQVEVVVRSYDAIAAMLRGGELNALGNLDRLAMDPER